MQARHGPSRSFPLGEHYEIGIRSELQVNLLSLTLFRRALHLTHEFRVLVKLVSALSDGVLKEARLADLRTSAARREGFGAILRSRGLGEGSPWLSGLARRVHVVELELSSLSVIGDP